MYKFFVLFLVCFLTTSKVTHATWFSLFDEEEKKTYVPLQSSKKVFELLEKGKTNLKVIIENLALQDMIDKDNSPQTGPKSDLYSFESVNFAIKFGEDLHTYKDSHTFINDPKVKEWLKILQTAASQHPYYPHLFHISKKCYKMEFAVWTTSAPKLDLTIYGKIKKDTAIYNIGPIKEKTSPNSDKKKENLKEEDHQA